MNNCELTVDGKKTQINLDEIRGVFYSKKGTKLALSGNRYLSVEEDFDFVKSKMFEKFRRKN